jgi:hypothetical protein
MKFLFLTLFLVGMGSSFSGCAIHTNARHSHGHVVVKHKHGHHRGNQLHCHGKKRLRRCHTH